MRSRFVLALVTVNVVLMLAVPPVAEHYRGAWWVLLGASLATAVAGAVLLWTSRKAANR